ncbi:MAG: hypothetical protein Q4F76_07725, partial [Lachnospiraceae bacterium]|nr:hypothetical protein [Lachnospiraceae bacterium]
SYFLYFLLAARFTSPLFGLFPARKIMHLPFCLLFFNPEAAPKPYELGFGAVQFPLWSDSDYCFSLPL